MVHTPPMALHCRDVRHTSDSVQSESVAAMHAPIESEQLPANAHCDDFLQSAFKRATQLPFSA
jgi:hypothetical protein